MKSIKIEMTSWMGKSSYDCEGETWADVLARFNDFQDLGCLKRQVEEMGTAVDRGRFAPFEEFIKKWMSGKVVKEDFAACRVVLSIGSFRCLSAADENGEIIFPTKRKKAATKTSPKNTNQ